MLRVLSVELRSPSYLLIGQPYLDIASIQDIKHQGNTFKYETKYVLLNNAIFDIWSSHKFTSSKYELFISKHVGETLTKETNLEIFSEVPVNIL
jgi:hypothetical protein